MNGQRVNLEPPPDASFGGARAAQQAASARDAEVASQLTILGLRTTLARINIPAKIAPEPGRRIALSLTRACVFPPDVPTL